MKDIKTKDKIPKNIKEHHKKLDIGKRMKDGYLKSKKEIHDDISEDNSIFDYGENKIKDTTINVKDKVVNDTKKVEQKLVQEAKNRYRGIKEKHKHPEPPEHPKGKEPKVRKRGRINNKENPRFKRFARHGDKSRFSHKNLNLGQRLAMKRARQMRAKNRKITAVFKSAIKGIMASFKSLIVAIGIGLGVATGFIVIICLIGILIVSIFGIFFSSHKNQYSEILMKDCIVELDKEMDTRIREIEESNEHDEVVIISEKASWKDILSVYAVKVSNGHTGDEVMTMNKKKKKALEDIFWDAHTISSTIKEEEYESTLIEDLEEIELEKEDEAESEETEETEKPKKKVLYIYIRSKTVDEMMTSNNFSYEQYKQYNEINSEEYSSLWNTVIYGEFEDIGELSEWKQKGKEWSNIKMGTSEFNIGDIGCLVTSISIQIKKSGIQTDIEPFNPGTFVIALNNVYGISSEGNLRYDSIAKVVPNFVYQGHVSLVGKKKEDKYNELKKYYDEGYYLVAEVYGANNNQHWVAIDTMSAGTINMFDPASSSDNMWEKYDYRNTSQFVYFKAIKET